MSKSKLFMRRVIAFAAALIMMVNIAAAPQRAKAVAVSASVVAAVAAIMTACGVSYWAASQTDAVDYLGAKIDDYLGTLETVPESYEDWLGINASSQLFEVVSGGVMRFGSGVANKVLDFVRWFNAAEGVESGGDPVGILGGPVDMLVNNQASYGGSVTPVLSSDNTLEVTFSGIKNHNTGSFYYLSLHLPGITGFTVTVLDVDPGNTTSISRGYFGSKLTSDYSSTQTGTNTYYVVGRSYSMNRDDSNYLALNFATPNKVASADEGGYSWKVTLGFSLTDGSAFVTDDEVRVSPSATVAVPDDVSQNDSLDVIPSVPLTAGMSVEDASTEIYTGITSEDGLTSEDDVYDGAAAGWGWLAELLERIRQAVVGTQEAVEGNQEAVQGIQESVEGTEEAVQGIQEAVEGIQEAVQPEEYYEIQNYQLNLTNFFPFCIPWDLFRGLSLLVADPIAPSIDWEVPLPNGSTYTLELDLSEWDGVAQVARTMELLAFVVALAVATKKLIKW